MPRLVASLLRRANSISPHLATLLPVCRDLTSARNELRWICEHVNATYTQSQGRSSRSRKLEQLCKERGKGVPLQYILGSQPFGPLEIQCRPGVLIPRPETEAWVYFLAQRVCELNPDLFSNTRTRRIRVVDFCTGTGCIPLLLTSLLGKTIGEPEVYGFDISPQAIALAQKNAQANKGCFSTFGEIATSPVHFLKRDVFHDHWSRDFGLTHGADAQIDILVSNPPYISRKGFENDTERSVRKYEPRLALVPETQLNSLYPQAKSEDVFYARLLEIAQQTRPKVVLFEVGDLEQATRVVELALSGGRWRDIEIWRDWPGMVPGPNEAERLTIQSIEVPLRGSGNGRTVFLRQR